MSFAHLESLGDSIVLLQRSLERGRLGHAYLFHGGELAALERVARTLAKALNCARPPRQNAGGVSIESCDACPSCRKIEEDMHPDVMWVRPESKSRLIKIEQMVERPGSLRPLLPAMHLKPTEARFKVGVIVAADRLNENAANSFLKTLEEPPSDCVFILLTSEPQRLLDTIISRCLRLNFGDDGAGAARAVDPWIAEFARIASGEQRSLLGRYGLLSRLLERLAEIKKTVTEEVTRRSPLEAHDDIESSLKEKWEDELAAAAEAEYRRERSELLSHVQWWLRDVWIASMELGGDMLRYPDLSECAGAVARRLGPAQAMENLQSMERLQRMLALNVQEALALEVGLLRLRL